jgi:hypothetical protein
MVPTGPRPLRAKGATSPLGRPHVWRLLSAKAQFLGCLRISEEHHEQRLHLAVCAAAGVNVSAVSVNCRFCAVD